MKKVVFSGIIILNVLFLNAQYEQDKFKETFDQEINGDDKYSNRENHSAQYQYVPPQGVPDWFIHPMVSDQNEVYAIGISDPGLDSTQSMDQAIYRAEIMAHVLQKSTTQLLCDFFLNEVNKSTNVVYEHFTRISSKIPNTRDNYIMVDSFRTAFDEALVLIKFSFPNELMPNQWNDIKMEFYKNEIESSRSGELESIYELQVNSPDSSMTKLHFYQLTEFGARYDVVSGNKEQVNPVPIYTLGYKGIPALDSVDQCYFSHGLWKEYLRSVMSQIIQNARAKPENIKFLGDDYKDDNQNNSYQKLTRGISVNRQRFVITGIKSKENKLLVEMQELPIVE